MAEETKNKDMICMSCCIGMLHTVYTIYYIYLQYTLVFVHTVCVYLQYTFIHTHNISQYHVQTDIRVVSGSGIMQALQQLLVFPFGFSTASRNNIPQHNYHPVARWLPDSQVLTCVWGSVPERLLWMSLWVIVSYLDVLWIRFQL